MKKATEYNHLKIEPKQQKEWQKKKLYEVKNGKPGKTFYGLVEFPFPSGAGLHTGHVRSYVAMDIISRKRRMQGFNVLYPMGWDAFGLPTENYAIKTGLPPAKVTKQNTDVFRRQLQSLGLSFDWSREVNTTDPAYYKWTQWIFLKMYEKGLAYKTKTTINWCPKDKIGLANEEVVNGCCERCGTPVEKREKEQWMLAITKYADRLDKDLDEVNYLEKIKIQQRNWIGKSEGSEIGFKIETAHSNVPKKILIGTRNESKFKMVKECMPSIPGVEFVSLNDIAPVDDSKLVEGMDFVENARMKAEFYFKATGIPTVSTDNVFWTEKWKKDNGVIIHIRKEANPKSDRATDEEVIAFIKKWLAKNGGSSRSHFVYAVAFADGTRTHTFISRQRDYMLQSQGGGTFSPGYPMEYMLFDPKNKAYKGDQVNEVRYDALVKDLAKHAPEWLAALSEVKTFTTRADTLFGAFAVILAPEHPLVSGLKDQIQNWKEVEAYVSLTKNKTDIERTAEDKEKTGVELTGIHAVNPANGEKIPVWIADFVLVQYGTGAIFADMHDERDYQFAKKYNLPMGKPVVEEKFVWDKTNATDGAIRPELPFVKRTAVAAIIRNPKNGKYLCMEWKKFHMHGLVTGGIEEGEDMVETALREIREETGYKHVRFVRDPQVAIHSLFYHRVKQENRWARFRFVFFDLVDDERDAIDPKEAEIHDAVWKTPEEMKKYFSVIEGDIALKLISNPDYTYTGEGVLVNSGEYTGMESAEARKKLRRRSEEKS